MKAQIKKYIGQAYHSLIVLGEYTIEYKEGGSRHRRLVCRCICGTITFPRASIVLNGRAKSCGCYRESYLRTIGIKHNKSSHQILKNFQNLKQRCYNPKNTYYHNYGGRGIYICEEWLKDPLTYFDWAIKNNWQPNLQIDRINNEGPYSPENCQFISFLEQQKNKRTNVYLEYKGQTKILTDWAKEFNLTPTTIKSRISRFGWTVEKALETRPMHKGGRPKSL